MNSKRERLYWSLGGAALLVAVGAAAAGPIMSRVEQPKYDVLWSQGPVELRRYGPLIAAEATVEGERKAAIEEGFRLIAAYIFGANQPRTKIEMTAPVEQQKIAMTAPVTQQESPGGSTWSVRFIMPSRWSLDTLPKPADARVRLVPVEARRMLAIRFSGVASEDRIAQETRMLERAAHRQQLSTSGTPLLAFYNPPWTLPFLRRNEILLEVGEP